MNRLTVTIVDILGVLIPGLVLLFGCILAPIPFAWVRPLNDTLLQRLPVLENTWVAGGCWLAIAYTLGFVIRLGSIGIMARLTRRRWESHLERQSAVLEKVLEASLANPGLAASLHALVPMYGKDNVGRHAPFFHFAKRLIRTDPDLWVEAERFEAEVRFAAGLFIPLLLLGIDGVVLAFTTPGGWILIIAGFGGAAILFSTFAARRTKEVLYDHFLALVILSYRHPDRTPRTPASSP